MLMDSKRHTAFTGSEARISRKVGGKFIAYDGSLEGTNLELVPDKKIVQSWRGSDWPEGHYSKAVFSLKEIDGGTRLTFTQTGVPADLYEDYRQGWHDYYWKPMKTLLVRFLTAHSIVMSLGWCWRRKRPIASAEERTAL
jgi:activator of HSP90 ATPase